MRRRPPGCLFADESFDLVTCRIAAHHFPDAQRFLHESARVLRPGGLLLLQGPDAARASAERHLD